MTKLIYTVSAGHSGSTLFDLLIGSIRGVFAAGALNCIMWQVHRNNTSEPSVGNEDICTCLQSFHDCSAWSKILDVLGRKAGFEVARHPMRFRIPLMRHAWWGYRSFSRDLDYKIYQRLVLNGYSRIAEPFFHWKYRNTIRNNWMLIDSIGEAEHVAYVSDSSKDFVRMNLLRSARPSDVTVILLIRELYGVVNSYLHGLGSKGKKDINIAGFCDSYVRFYNSIARYCVENDVDPVIVRYEDMVCKPEGLRRALAARLDLVVDNAMHLDTRNNHLVAGNPMRYRGEVNIQYDKKWQKQLNEQQCALIGKKMDGLDSIYTVSTPDPDNPESADICQESQRSESM